ncbi:MAG: acylphosphatase [Lysobacterales bacterium]
MGGRVAACFRVTGRVQGVGFRASTRMQARVLGLDGSAKNLGDGSVEVRVAGASGAVEHMGEWLAHGPASASVAQVERHSIEVDAVPHGFVVR